MRQKFIIPKTSSFNNPGLAITPTGRYAMPGWFKVNDDTELEDISIDMSSIKPINTFQEIFNVTGSKGDLYQVTISSSRGNHCTCHAFQFRKTCKHINETIQNINKQT